MPKASGRKVGRLLKLVTRKNAKSERSASEPMIIQRRPPAIRSIAGPISGESNANGAIAPAR